MLPILGIELRHDALPSSVHGHALVNQRCEEGLLHLEGAGRDGANGARAQPLGLYRLVARGGEGNFVLTGLNARILRGRLHLRFLLYVG